MKRQRVAALILLAFCACSSGKIELTRGDLGPAFYEISFDVSGTALVGQQSFDATLEVTSIDTGAVLTLDTGDGPPVTTTLRRTGDRLTLETVEGISAQTAGEADLAAITGQIAAPLPDEPVSVGDSWRAFQNVSTETVETSLTTELRAAGFDVVAGQDALNVNGKITGRLKTKSQSSAFDGTVVGTSRFAWDINEGRLLKSKTVLTWTLTDGAVVTLDVTLRTSKAP